MEVDYNFSIESEKQVFKVKNRIYFRFDNIIMKTYIFQVNLLAQIKFNTYGDNRQITLEL